MRATLSTVGINNYKARISQFSNIYQFRVFPQIVNPSVVFLARHFILWVLGLLSCLIRDIISKLAKVLKVAHTDADVAKWWAESAPRAARGKYPLANSVKI